jgi:hypothetical protein
LLGRLPGAARSNKMRDGGRGVARCRSGLWLGWNIDAATNQQKQIDDEDCDQDEAADEDVGPESEHSFVLRKIGWRDVAVFVVLFVHADKLICKRDRVRE